MAADSISVDVNVSYNNPTLKDLHSEIERLVRAGESEIHVFMFVDGKCFQLDLQPTPKSTQEE